MHDLGDTETELLLQWDEALSLDWWVRTYLFGTNADLPSSVHLRNPFTHHQVPAIGYKTGIYLRMLFRHFRLRKQSCSVTQYIENEQSTIQVEPLQRLYSRAITGRLYSSYLLLFFSHVTFFFPSRKWYAMHERNNCDHRAWHCFFYHVIFWQEA